MEESTEQRAIDLAWAAGLFEGEGSFLLTRQSTARRRGYLNLKVTMTDEDIVRKLHRILGVGRVTGPFVNAGDPGHWKPHWRWDARGRAALVIVSDPLFTNHLGARRRGRLYEILSFIEQQPAPEKNPRSTHCSRGHEFTPENTLRTTNRKGHNVRVCLACRRIRARERYHANLDAHRTYAREWARARKEHRGER